MNVTNSLNSNTVFHTWERSHCLVCFETNQKIFCIRERFIAHTSGGVSHCFHKKCLIEWLKLPRSQGKCPLCQIHLDISNIKLTPSLLEQGIEQVELLAKSALRGAYWKIWAWAIVQPFGNQTFHLSSLLFHAVEGAFIACKVGIEAKICSKVGQKLTKYLPFPSEDQWVINNSLMITYQVGTFFFQKTTFRERLLGHVKGNTETFAIRLIYAPLQLLSSDGFSFFAELTDHDPAVPFISNRIYQWSKKAIPFLIAGIAYRTFDFLANSY